MMLLIAFGVALLLCLLLASRYSPLKSLDVPNERSLHDRPTPHTGGVAIILAVFITWLVQALLYGMPESMIWIAVSALLVAGVSFIDASEFLLKQSKQFLIHYEIGTATIGSIACCHMKDSSYNNPPYYYGGMFSKYCVKIRFINADGEINTWTKEGDKENFAALTSSHGLFGIIIEAAFTIEDLSLCHVTHHLTTWDGLKEYTKSPYCEPFFYYGIPFKNIVLLEFRKKVPMSLSSTIRRSRFFTLRNRLWKKTLPLLSVYIQAFLPVPKKIHYRLIDSICAISYYAIAYIFKDFYCYPHDQVIFYPSKSSLWSGKYIFNYSCISKDKFPAFLDNVLTFQKNHYNETGQRVDIGQVGYFIKKDRKDETTLLSYSRHTDQISIDLIDTTKDKEKILNIYEKLLKNLKDTNANAHVLFNQTWGTEKIHLFGTYDIEAFKEKREEIDPENRFYTKYFKKLFDKTWDSVNTVRHGT